MIHDTHVPPLGLLGELAEAGARLEQAPAPTVLEWPVDRFGMHPGPEVVGVAGGEDRRAGRWSGSDKTECGLHQ